MHCVKVLKLNHRVERLLDQLSAEDKARLIRLLEGGREGIEEEIGYFQSSSNHVHFAIAGLLESLENRLLINSWLTYLRGSRAA